MTLSNDGNRAYIADPNGRDMLILDTSEIQARKPDPQTHEISRITWDKASIPQNAIPFTSHGKPYVLEFDEYNASTLGTGSPDDVGAARIIDISDETQPRIVSYLRLQVNQPAEHAAAGGDPGADGPTHGGAQGYAAHYCNIPTRVDPKIVACSFIVSGLRIFNIADVTKPREIGYFVAPTQAKPENGGQASDFAMSMPAFAARRHEIWFTDGTSGFYALRVNNDVWPSNHVACTRKTRFTATLKLPRHTRARSVRVRFGKKRVHVLRVKRGKHRVRVTVSTRHLHTGRLRYRIKLSNGKSVLKARRYRPACASH
jgi:hypothetical protein